MTLNVKVELRKDDGTVIHSRATSTRVTWMSGKGVGEDERHVHDSCFYDLSSTLLRAMRDNWPETEEWNDEANQGLEVRSGRDP
jgi:hypothetical protein